MSFVEKNLLPSEAVVLQAKLHWIMFVKPAVLFLVTVIFFCLFCKEAFSDTYEYLVWYFWGTCAFLLFSIYTLGKALIAKYTVEYVLTNKRLVLKRGLIKRQYLELQLEKCEGIVVTEPLLGRFLNYGTIVVTTGGATSHYDKVADAFTFRNRITEEMGKALAKKS